MATKQTQLLARTLLTPAVGLLFVWMIVPLALTIYFSTLHYNLLEGDAKQFVGLDNFRYFLTDPAFLASLQNTLVLVDGLRISENELTSAQLNAIALESIERIEIVPHPEFRFVAETRASKPLVTVGDRPVHHVANGVVVKMEVEGDSIVQADILPEKTVAFDHAEAEGDHFLTPAPDKEKGLVLHVAAEPAEIVGCQFLETEFRTVEDL